MLPEPPPQPVVLPLELWERIFLRLSPVQIVALRAVNRDFRGIIDGSPEVQYLIDLYAAGLEPDFEDPSLTIADRRAQLDQYRSHWDSFNWVKHTSLPLPHYKEWSLGGGVICFMLFADPALERTTDYWFIQLPSVLRHIPLREWTLHGLPNVLQPPGLLPEEDLLVICSHVGNNRLFTVQFRRMSDGQFHPGASVSIIRGPICRKGETVHKISDIKITSSRLAILLPLPDRSYPHRPGSVYRLIVWDWRTGVKHVDIRGLGLQAQFIDEHRIITVCDRLGLKRSFVALIDTSVPIKDPQKPREVELELDSVPGSPNFVSLLAGTHAQDARLGSPFRTHSKGHFLGIGHRVTSEQSFAINYENICAIATENWSSSRIPWNIWKHRTTQIGRYPQSPLSSMFIGPRAFEVPEDIFHGPWVRSFDFTPGARRFTKPPDPSTEVEPQPVSRLVMLREGLMEGPPARWAISEDNILLIGAQNPDSPPDLRILMWTF